MQQLLAIFQQRNADIKLMKEEEKQYKKIQFQQRERGRIQRENWIIKVIKTIKIFTIQNKKSIFDASLKMMALYHPNIAAAESVDLEKNFTGDMINLFVSFYTECNQQDLNAIKKILRPNNAFVATDLVKQLIETHRQYFKVKLSEAFKQATKLVQQKSKPRLFPTLSMRREQPMTEPSQTEDEKKEESQDLKQISQKIKQAVFEKWQHYINLSMPSQLSLKSKINDAYLQLLQRNSQNNFMIHKFQQKCYGKSKTFAYNVVGLYSQQEIKKMESKLKHDVKQKYANIKQLRGSTNAEQLRQYFKIKTEIQQNNDKIESKKINLAPINSWVPLIVSKSNSQINPLSIFVNFNKQQIIVEQFAQKCGISLRNYMKMIIKDRIEKHELKMQISELKYFKKHHYFDLNHAKKKQLMNDQPRLYAKDKKQSIFPMLRSNELRQQTQIALKNRSMSEHKVGSSYRKQAIARKVPNLNQQQITEQNSSHKYELEAHQSSTSILQKTTNSRQDGSDKLKWVEQKQNLTLSNKSKIDNIIMLILNQRNLNISNN